MTAAAYTYKVNPSDGTDIVRRLADLQQTLKVLGSKIRYEKPGETGSRTLYQNLPPSMRDVRTLSLVLPPEQLEELMKDARGELELIAEAIANVIDRDI